MVFPQIKTALLLFRAEGDAYLREQTQIEINLIVRIDCIGWTIPFAVSIAMGNTLRIVQFRHPEVHRYCALSPTWH